MRIENQAVAGDLRVFIYRNTDRVQSVALASFAIKSGSAIEWDPPEHGNFAVTVYRDEQLDRVMTQASFVAFDARIYLKDAEDDEIQIAIMQDRIA